MSKDSSAMVMLYDSKGKGHKIRVTYVELPGQPALKFNDPANSMYLGGP